MRSHLPMRCTEAPFVALELVWKTISTENEQADSELVRNLLHGCSHLPTRCTEAPFVTGFEPWKAAVTPIFQLP